MGRQFDIEFKPGKAEAADKAGDEKCREEGRKQQEKKVVAGHKCRKTDQHDHQGKDEPQQRDLLAHAFFQ